MAGGYRHSVLPTHTHPGKRSGGGADGARLWGAAVAAALIFIALLNAVYFAQSDAAARAGSVGGAAHPSEQPMGPSRPAATVGGGGGGGGDGGSIEASPAEAAALAYLQEFVLKKPQLVGCTMQGHARAANRGRARPPCTVCAQHGAELPAHAGARAHAADSAVAGFRARPTAQHLQLFPHPCRSGPRWRGTG
jgi:hypothetical protein